MPFLIRMLLVFFKKYHKICFFFAENWQKSQKIVIITSTPRTNLTTSEFTITYNASVEVG
jgi:hypothetical protein